MKPDALRIALQSKFMPLMLCSNKGFSTLVHEKLWSYVNGGLPEEELEDFLAYKLEDVLAHQELLETMEYPVKAENSHSQLFEAFLSYEAALSELEEYLWGDDESEDKKLSELMRDFLAADRLVSSFESSLSKQVRGVWDNESSRLSLKG